MEFYKRMKVLHTLTFSYTFEYENDIVFFSHFFPYTFTDLERYLAKITSQEKYRKFLRIDILCKSLSNNPCYTLTITNKMRTYLGSQDEAILLKKSNAAREMMKKKMDRIEALQSHLKSQKETSSTSASSGTK